MLQLIIAICSLLIVFRLYRVTIGKARNWCRIAQQKWHQIIQ